MVFHDEGDFHSQLIKLVGVTKVPLILTMSNLTPDLETTLMNPLREPNVAFDIVNYKYMKMNPKEM